MPRNLYTPRLSDDVVRSLYREGRRRRMPMTRLADELLRSALANSVSADIRPFDPEEAGAAPPRVDAA